MKKIIFYFVVFVSSVALKAQNVVISDDSTYNSTLNNVILEVHSANGDKGVVIPRLTTAERDSMGQNLPNSLLIFNTTTNCYEWWDAYGQQWIKMSCGCPPVQPSTYSHQVSFSYTGSMETWTVPSGVCWIKIKAWGAGGGGGGADGGDAAAPGGAGGYVEKVLQTHEGDILKIYVPEGGHGGAGSVSGIGGGSGGWGYASGGDGGNAGPSGSSGGGGGGAGCAAILYNDSLIIVAAGGGGGGGNGHTSVGSGGAAGENGGNGDGTGGQAGMSSSLAGGNGGSNSNDGGGAGGGGAGYNGGTGGIAASCDCGAGGGGGGLNLCAGSNCYTENGSGQTPGNASDTDRPSGIGEGGTEGTGSGNGSNGGNGYIIIYY